MPDDMPDRPDMPCPGPAPAAAPVAAGATLPVGLRRISSDSLFSGAREIGIDHQGALYRLQITRQGKLILIK